MKHYTAQELLTINNRAPLLVQDTMSSNLTIATIANIGTKLKLHIDQIGLIAELNVQLLLGLIGSEEFLKDLIEAKIPEKDAREIMKEINEKIFVPLREEMRKGTAQMGRNEPLRRSDLRSVLASVTSEVPPVKLLEDHEEPHINIGVRDKVQGASPPANLPGVIHHPPIIPPPSPVPIQHPSPPPPTHPVPLKPKPVVPIAPYSSDPYREPVE